MFDMFLDSVKLLLRGRLFKDSGTVAVKATMGAGIAALLCVTLALTGTPLWLAVMVASLTGGGIQPWLFKDLRYQ